MTELRQGDIVKVEVVDPQHRNPKVRPVIILNPSEEIDAEMELAAIAITGTVPDPLPGSFVLLPYHPRGHPRTGLQKRSAAVCDWFRKSPTASVEIIFKTYTFSVAIAFAGIIAKVTPRGIYLPPKQQLGVQQ
jgi:hypothetical protein